jgi:hypothetical protein
VLKYPAVMAEYGVQVQPRFRLRRGLDWRTT